MLVLAVAVFAAAFTTHKTENKKLFSNWFEYRGPLPASDADLKEESNYFLVESEPPCEGADEMCAINVAGTGQHPDAFTSTIESDLVSAKNTQTPVQGYIDLRN